MHNLLGCLFACLLNFLPKINSNKTMIQQLGHDLEGLSVSLSSSNGDISELSLDRRRSDSFLTSGSFDEDDSTTSSSADKNALMMGRTTVLRSLPRPAEAKEIRGRYFLRLGFDKHIPDPNPSTTTKALSSRQHVNKKVHHDCSHETLKYDHGKVDTELEDLKSLDPTCSLSLSTRSSGALSFGRSSHERGVSFQASVVVHTIPSHKQYSDRIRNTLWTPEKVMREDIARNCVEFVAEGWDWRTCVDDNEMVHYNGEMIHPVHFGGFYQPNLGWRFCAVRAKQQQLQG